MENSTINHRFDSFKTLGNQERHLLTIDLRDEERSNQLSEQFFMLEQALPDINQRNYSKNELKLLENTARPMILTILGEVYHKSSLNDIDDFLTTFIDKQKDIYYRKNADYGNAFGDSIHHYGPIAYFVRANDKIRRIVQLSKNGYQAKVSEQLDDTYCDLFNYTIMFLDEIEASISYAH